MPPQKSNSKNSHIRFLQLEKRVIILLIVVFSIMLTLVILNNTDFDSLIKKAVKDDGVKQNSIYFYPPDYESDIFTDSTYMSKNRLIYYSANGLTFPLMDNDDISTAGECGEFFVKYFDILTHGRSECYNAIFTNEYYDLGNKPLDSFTMQKIYNIKVELLTNGIVAEKGSFYGKNYYCFKVSYCIMQNDGTFRNDMPSDTVVPQYIELINIGTEILINSVAKITYTD